MKEREGYMQIEFKKFGWLELSSLLSALFLGLLVYFTAQSYFLNMRGFKEAIAENKRLESQVEDYRSMLWGSDTHRALRALQRMEDDKAGYGGGK